MSYADVVVERAHEEIVHLREQLSNADTQIKDLEVQIKFWRHACEQALDGWNRLEEEHELLKDTLRALTTPEALE